MRERNGGSEPNQETLEAYTEMSQWVPLSYIANKYY
jgi:hypothetical protein